MGAVKVRTGDDTIFKSKKTSAKKKLTCTHKNYQAS